MPGDETRPTAYEPGAQRRRPSLERWDIPYEERLRGQRRERERNVQHIVQAERHWEIARLTLSRMAGENELLRGVHIAEQNRLLWWPARIMSHGEGLWVMKRYLDEHIHDRDLTEVEINRTDENELLLEWGSARNTHTAFDDHPIHQDLVDGCLAVRGRPIIRQGNGLRLAPRPNHDNHIPKETP